jgi:hypothetical protein
MGTEGCGVLFKSKAGNILVCGEPRGDGCRFLCKRCLNENSKRNNGTNNRKTS